MYYISISLIIHSVLYHNLEHNSCHCMSQRMQAFYVINLPCL